MKYINIALILIFLPTVMNARQHNPIIPKPLERILGEGHFQLNDQTVIAADLGHPDAVNLAVYLQELLSAPTTWSFPIVELKEAPGSNSIRLFIESGEVYDPTTHPALWNPDPNTVNIDAFSSPEHYILDITDKNISIRGKHAPAVFYGIQSLRQLLPAHVELRDYSRVPMGTEWVVPVQLINDAPRFGWRGMHLDVGRHFMPVSFVKKYIDLLALHKMNTFHWHLTEDQGWRIAIDKYPLLTEIGAWRDSTLIGNYGSGRYDNIRYGGYYTKEDIREVIEYATSRYITIVPEIEMPGHASAALAAYPEFGCQDLEHEYKVQSTWGIFPEIFCPTEETFSFLKDILTEVMELFPGPFIHIGGDEAMKDHWQASQIAQDIMRREGLADEHELQSYFIRRIDAFLDAKGRRLVGWDEILEGGLAPNATVMSWRGESGGIAAAQMGHDAVMSPTGFAYFDYYQSENRANEPIAIGGFLPLERVYGYEPIPAELSEELHPHILGAQGNVWTEYMKSEEKVEYMAFPRLIAMSEVVWSPKDMRNYDGFIDRLRSYLVRLDLLDVHYRPLD